MSMKAISWAWDQKADLPEAKLVLVLLADAAGDDGRCFFSEKLCDWLADHAEISHERLGEIILVDPLKSAILPIYSDAGALVRAATAKHSA